MRLVYSTAIRQFMAKVGRAHTSAGFRRPAPATAALLRADSPGNSNSSRQLDDESSEDEDEEPMNR